MNLIRFITITLFLILIGWFLINLFLYQRKIYDESALYKTEVFAGNEIYWVKDLPKKVNDHCWYFEIYWQPFNIFYCGEIYIKP